MNINDISIKELAFFISTIGVLCGVFYKLFSTLNDIRIAKKSAEDAHKRIDDLITEQKTLKDELLTKVEETNCAVNLICKAVSALIHCQLVDDEINVDELKRVKQQLDDKKELI